MGVGHWWNDSGREILRYLGGGGVRGESLSHFHFVQQNSHVACLGIESGCMLGEDSNYCLNCGTTQYLLLRCMKAFECTAALLCVCGSTF